MSLARQRLRLDRVALAARTIDPVFRHSPQFECEPLGQALGVRLALKVETMNPIRSFKGRGADFDAAKLAARRAAAEQGLRFVEDGLAVETLEGAGTMALEWLESAAFRGQFVGTIVCGGNLTAEQMQEWLWRERHAGRRRIGEPPSRGGAAVAHRRRVDCKRPRVGAGGARRAEYAGDEYVRTPRRRDVVMKKLFSFVGATAGGYVGWYIGAYVGIFTAFIVSMIGTGIGMYYAVKYAKTHFD